MTTGLSFQNAHSNLMGNSFEYNYTDTQSGELNVISADYVPEEFKLHSNFPNSFHEITRIMFDIPKAAHVKLTVYDFFGKKIVSLIDREMDPGHYKVVFNNNRFKLPTGVYMYKLSTDEYADTKKMVLLKLITNN